MHANNWGPRGLRCTPIEPLWILLAGLSVAQPGMAVLTREPAARQSTPCRVTPHTCRHDGTTESFLRTWRDPLLTQLRGRSSLSTVTRDTKHGDVLMLKQKVTDGQAITIKRFGSLPGLRHMPGAQVWAVWVASSNLMMRLCSVVYRSNVLSGSASLHKSADSSVLFKHLCKAPRPQKHK